MRRCTLLGALLMLPGGATVLDTGLALTPPAGWRNWDYIART